jgi:hypothetical protein
VLWSPDKQKYSYQMPERSEEISQVTMKTAFWTVEQKNHLGQKLKGEHVLMTEWSRSQGEN